MRRHGVVLPTAANISVQPHGTLSGFGLCYDDRLMHRIAKTRPAFAGSLAALLAALLAEAFLLSPALADEPGSVDLQLILAVDSSSSVDGHEYKLQLAGIATALRDPEVLSAIQSGPVGQIAVCLVRWSGPTERKIATPWHILHDANSVAAFAALVEALPRRLGGGTGIGKAVTFAVDLFDKNGLESPRRVIDLSGDGAETAWREWSVSPQQARAYALARGVTINGLAIMTDDPTLDRYYRAEVIAGPEAFVMSVESLADFPAVMRLKLLREIEHRPQVSRVPG